MSIYKADYALLGNPVSHSLSPFIHQAFADATKQIMAYRTIKVPLDNFMQTLHAFFQQGGAGCNITHPFKESAYRLCDFHTERAQLAKAVNTIVSTPAGLLGDNTDGIGLLVDLKSYMALSHKNILVLGAGGAARGAIAALIKANPHSITIANRSIEKALSLYQQFSKAFTPLRYTSLSQLPTDTFDIIINATSASIQNDSLGLIDTLFRYTQLAYELDYGKRPSQFLQQARHCHVPYAISGLGMLVHQAAESFYLWRGVYPDPYLVLAKLQKKVFHAVD